MQALVVVTLTMVMTIAGNVGIGSLEVALVTSDSTTEVEQSELISRGSYRSQSGNRRGEAGRREILS